MKLPVRQAASKGALVTSHEEDLLSPGDFPQSLPKRISCPEGVNVVVEEHHPDHFRPVVALLELGQDHGVEDEGSGHVRGEDVGNLPRFSFAR